MINKSNELSEKPILISDTLIPIDAYQAIFYKMTRKVNQITKGYAGGYHVTQENIANLDTFIQQFLKQYQVKARSVEITHQIKDSTTLTYASLNHFMIDGMLSTKKTSLILYETDFLINLPQEIEHAKDIIQKYKLSILIANNDGDDGNGDGDDFLSLFDHFFSRPKIRMSLEYIDYNVSLSLQATVEQWVTSLQKENETRITRYIIKKRNLLMNVISTIMMCSPFIGAILLINRNNYNNSMLCEIFSFCIITLILFRFITGTIINNIFSYSFFFNPQMRICLTKGDVERIKTIDNKRKSSKNKLAFLFFGIFLSIILNLLSSWIYTIL